MGGPVGVMSAKLAVKGGVLLFAARVGMHSLVATVDPTSAAGTIAPEVASGHADIARYLDGAPGHHLSVGLDHQEIPIGKLAAGKPPGGAQLALGLDQLSRMVIVFDFPRSRLDVLDRSQIAHAGRGMTALPVSVSRDGCLTFRQADESGTGIEVALANIDEAAAGTPISGELSGQRFRVFRNRTTSCAGTPYVMGWGSFEGRKIEIDMARNVIFVG